MYDLFVFYKPAQRVSPGIQSCSNSLHNCWSGAALSAEAVGCFGGSKRNRYRLELREECKLIVLYVVVSLMCLFVECYFSNGNRAVQKRCQLKFTDKKEYGSHIDDLPIKIACL